MGVSCGHSMAQGELPEIFGSDWSPKTKL